jgi:Domain of unknown function (DUF4412)
MCRSWKGALAASGIACLIGTARVASAQTGFEGVITFITRGDNGRADTAIQTTKGNKFRYEAGVGGKGAMIYNGDDHTRTILMAEQKKYMRMTPEDAKAQMSRMSARLDTAPPVKMEITPTGKTETVAGVSCQDFHTSGNVAGRPQEADVCVAKGVGFAMFSMMGEEGMMMAQHRSTADAYKAMRSLLSDNRGILKVTEIKDGKPVVSLEAIKIDQKPVSDAAFVAPPDYTAFQMPQMPGAKSPTP